MAKELSDMLTDLSNHAKNVEDAFAAIAEETDDAAAQRRERTHAAASAAMVDLDQSLSSTGASLAGHWKALQHSLDAEVKGIQADIADRKHARDVSQAEKQADAAKERAAKAVAFAAAAVQTAGAAVLDAAVAGREAEALKRQ